MNSRQTVEPRQLAIAASATLSCLANPIVSVVSISLLLLIHLHAASVARLRLNIGFFRSVGANLRRCSFVRQQMIDPMSRIFGNQTFNPLFSLITLMPLLRSFWPLNLQLPIRCS